MHHHVQATSSVEMAGFILMEIFSNQMPAPPSPVAKARYSCIQRSRSDSQNQVCRASPGTEPDAQPLAALSGIHTDCNPRTCS